MDSGFGWIYRVNGRVDGWMFGGLLAAAYVFIIGCVSVVRGSGNEVY